MIDSSWHLCIICWIIVHYTCIMPSSLYLLHSNSSTMSVQRWITRLSKSRSWKKMMVMMVLKMVMKEFGDHNEEYYPFGIDWWLCLFSWYSLELLGTIAQILLFAKGLVTLWTLNNFEQPWAKLYLLLAQLIVSDNPNYCFSLISHLILSLYLPNHFVVVYSSSFCREALNTMMSRKVVISILSQIEIIHPLYKLIRYIQVPHQKKVPWWHKSHRVLTLWLSLCSSLWS